MEFQVSQAYQDEPINKELAQMSYRHFMIIFEDLPITKSEVKEGRISQEAIIACRCVNVGLFLSNDMRRDTEVSLVIMKDGVQIITFPGKNLRRVSPDERSISFFILKAIDLLARLPAGVVRELDNGIRVERTTINDLSEKWNSIPLFIAEEYDHIRADSDVKFVEGGFIYEIHTGLLPDSLFDKKPIRLSRPTSPERFILEINYQIDLNQ